MSFTSLPTENGYHFPTKRLWEYDPLSDAINKYWIQVIAKPQFTCSICYDIFPSRMIWSECPTHNEEHFCSDCLKQYVLSKINEGGVYPDNTITCPCSTADCSGRVTEQIVLSLLGEDHPTIEKFHKFALNAEVLSDNRKIFCPNRQCGGVVTRTSRWTTNITCQECHMNFCFNCRESHSSWISCNLSGDMQFKKWRKSTRQGCKKCPSCQIYIEKNDGCMHMTCVKCRHEFCWECMSGWSGSCSSPKAYHNTMKVLNADIWGQSLTTRTVTKSVGLPLICAVGCGIGGVALGAASIAATCVIISSPIAAGVYLYKHPPRAIRRLYYRMTRRQPVASPFQMHSTLQAGVIVSLPWQHDDPNYLSTLQGMRSTGELSDGSSFMGIQGRSSHSIFVGYINHQMLSSFVAYFVPIGCPQEHIDELSLQLDQVIRVSYPANTIPYSDHREEDEAVLQHLYHRIQLAVAAAVV